MTDYYLSTGITGKDHREIVHGTIKDARIKAWKILDRTNKPVSVSRIIDRGRSEEYLGTVRRWGIYVDKYGIDRSDIYACWVDAKGEGHELSYKGTISKNKYR